MPDFDSHFNAAMNPGNYTISPAVTFGDEVLIRNNFIYILETYRNLVSNERSY